MNGMTLEEMANMSIDQLEALSAKEGEGAGGDKQDVTGASSGAGTEAAGGADATSTTTPLDGEATKEEEGAEPGKAEEEGAFVETKSGKGKIPFSVLKDTREEVARLREELEQVKGQRTGYTVELPHDHDAKVQAINADIEELTHQFENGDIEWEAYRIKHSDLMHKRETMLFQSLKAEVAQEMAQQGAAEAWGQEVTRFMGTERDGINYTQDEAKRNDLDLFVKILGQDPANADRPYDWFLKTAHTAVLAKHGGQPSTAGATTEQGKNSQAQGGKTPTQGNDEAPIRSLSDIPGGILPAGSEFEQLGGMSEEALAAKMITDPALINKYLATLR